jgi:hypothetical protein
MKEKCIFVKIRYMKTLSIQTKHREGNKNEETQKHKNITMYVYGFIV